MAVNIRKSPRFVSSYSVYHVSLILAFFFSSAVLITGINCFNSRDFLMEEYSHPSWVCAAFMLKRHILLLVLFKNYNCCFIFCKHSLFFLYLETIHLGEVFDCFGGGRVADTKKPKIEECSTQMNWGLMEYCWWECASRHLHCAMNYLYSGYMCLPSVLQEGTLELRAPWEPQGCCNIAVVC